MADVSVSVDVPYEYEGKILVQRYRVKDHYFRNKYASFCNAIQMPGIVHVHAGALVEVNPPQQTHYSVFPSLYDYFGFSMKNPQEVSIDPSSRFVNFIELFPHTTIDNNRSNN